MDAPSPPPTPPRPTPPPALVAPARAALWRGGLAALLFAVLLPIVSLRGLSGTLLNVMLALGLGVVVGALAAAEHLARRGRPKPAIAWAAVISLTGVLLAGAQAGYTEATFTEGPREALDLGYRGVWLALYDPLTLPVVLLWAVALAAPTLARVLPGRKAWAAGAGPVVVAALLVTPWLMHHRGLFLGLKRGVLPGAPRVGLPVGAELGKAYIESGSSTTLTETLGFWLAWATGDDLAAHARSLVFEALYVAAALAVGGAIAAAVGDRLTARGTLAEPQDDDEGLRADARPPLALAVGLLATLAWVGGRAPFAAHVPWLVEVDMFSSERVLDRVGRTDTALLPPLVAILDDTTSRHRYTAARLIEDIGPPFTPDEVAVLERAVADTSEPDMASIALRTLIWADGVQRRRVVELIRAHIVAGASTSQIEMLCSAATHHRRWQDFDPLRRFARDPDPTVAIRALSVLASPYHPDDEAFERLAAFLRDPVHGGAAARALANGDDHAVRFIRERLARSRDLDNDPLLRVVPVLRQTPTSLALLTSLLDSPSPGARAAALQGLGGKHPDGRWDQARDELLARVWREPEAEDLLLALASHGSRVLPHIEERLSTTLDPRVRVALERVREAILTH